MDTCILKDDPRHRLVRCRSVSLSFFLAHLLHTHRDMSGVRPTSLRLLSQLLSSDTPEMSADLILQTCTHTPSHFVLNSLSVYPHCDACARVLVRACVRVCARARTHTHMCSLSLAWLMSLCGECGYVANEFVWLMSLCG